MRIVTLFSLMITLPVMAANTVSNNNDSQNKDSQYSSSLSNGANNQLTEHEKSLAKQWLLEESDWIKYKQIMQGPRGTWSPDIDPLTALGVSETDPQERKRYADIWLKMEGQRAKYELAFDMEIRSARYRVLGDMPIIDNTAQVASWQEEHESVKKYIALFVDKDCKEECKNLVKNLKESIGDNNRLDVYFQSGVSSEDIGDWATFMGISPEVVKSRRITLNYDRERSVEYGVDLNELPQVRVYDIKTGNIKVINSKPTSD